VDPVRQWPIIKIGLSGTGAFFNALENLRCSIQEKRDDHNALWVRNSSREIFLKE
jgi:hypothetical protein